MTPPDDPTPPESPPDPAPEPPEPPHGLVEELKEEIQEVVEHVPQPVRWTISRIVWLVVLSVVGLVIVTVVSIGLYLAHRTEWVAQEVALLLNQALAVRSDLVLEMKDLKGNLLTGVRVVHPVVRFRDGDEAPVLEARELSVRYSAWGVITHSKSNIEIEMDQPVFQLPRRPDGSTRFPVWRSSGVGGSRPRVLNLGLTVKDASMRMAALKPGIDGLDLRAQIRLGFGTFVRIDRMSWKKGPWGNPLDQLRGSIDAGDSVRVQVDELRSPALALSGRVAWKSRERRRTIEATVDRVTWAWLAKVFDNGTFNVPGQGRIELSAVADSVSNGKFRTRFDWNGLTADGTGNFLYSGGRLVVRSMEAQSSAGHLVGQFEMQGKRWRLEAKAEHSDPRTWSAFHLMGWPQGDVSGTFELGQNEHHDMDLTARIGPSVLAGWRADSARVRYMGPGATTDSFTVDFMRRGGLVRLRAGTRDWGWLGGWDATSFPLDEWPDGRASGIRGTLLAGHGNVVSRAGALQVDGDLDGTSTDWLGARMARWSLTGVNGRLLPSPDLHASARLSNVMFLGLHFDSSKVDFQLGDRRVELNHVAGWGGDTLLTAAGRGSWNTGGWDLGLDQAEMKSSQFDWVADPPVLLAGDPHGVDFVRLLAHDGDARLDCRGRWAAPGGIYQFDAVAHRLDVGRLGLPLDWQLGGHADARLEVRGPNGDPSWSLTASCLDPAESGHRADSLRLELGGAQHRLEVKRFELTTGGGHLSGQGRIEGTDHAWPDTLTGDGVVRWLAHSARWVAQAAAEHLPLATIDHLLPRPIGWSGVLDGHLDLGGRPDDPVVSAEAKVLPFGWREFSVDAVSLHAGFGGQRLKVEELRLTRGSVSSVIAGSMPMHAALGEKVEIPDAAMDWTVAIPNGDLALLPAFVPQIGWAKGKFDLHSTVGGTAREPKLSGTMGVREGAVRLAGREEVLDRLSADFHFDQSRITLDSLHAQQGSQGTVRARGVVDLNGMALRGYRFDLALRQFTAVEAGLYAAEFDGDFVVSNGRRIHGATLPQVTGQVDLRSAAVLFDFANQSETQQLAATTQPLFWTYRVQLNATRNLHWQPPDGDIEFSADLTLEQTPDSLQIYGDLTSLRGTYYFLSNRFDVTRADLTFDNETGVNPQLDIEASARVLPTQDPNDPLLASSNAQPQTHTVTARITGRADEPVVEFSTSPADWDESRILRELTVGRFYDARKGVQIGDPLDNYLTRAINRTVSSEVSRAFKGYINEWAIERERGGLLGGQGDLVMGVGSQITPNLSLRYKQRLPGLGRQVIPGEIDNSFERDVEAEYRLNRFFYVTTELTQRRALGSTNATTVGGPDFNVNLKARWEY